MEDSRSLRQARTLSHHGKELYKQAVDQFTSKLREEHRYIDIILEDMSKHSVIGESLAYTFKEDILKHTDIFDDISDDYMKYLTAQRSEDSFDQKAAHSIETISVHKKVSEALKKLDSILKAPALCDENFFNVKIEPKSDLDENLCPKSYGLYHVIPPPPQFAQSPAGAHQIPPKKAPSVNSQSCKSKSLKASSLIVCQRMKVESARSRVRFAQEEVELLRKQAAAQASLKLLNLKREVEKAEHELHIMTETFEEESVSSGVDEHEIQKRTAEFILGNSVKNEMTNNYTSLGSNLNIHAPPFEPSKTHIKMPSHAQVNFPTQTNNNFDSCKELTQFIVKKDLLLSRLSKYDDSPGYFLAWKASFQNVMQDLDVNPSEEIDLLVKWLGPESSRHALSIRAANAANPSIGVARLWARLDDRYGSPEIVESSLRKKLYEFPKIGNRDYKRLFDLVDIISEIEAVKENPRYMTLFSVYDSSAGVNPIAAKLPFGLQEKWTVEATRYKVEHNMVYPPFSVFVKFMHRMAKMKNDPSFFYEDSKETKAYVTPQNRHRNPRAVRLSCARTEMTKQTKFSDDKSENPGIICPLHGTSHTLNNCRGFRTKPISERKEFLKKHGLCFRCCGQRKHLRKDCKELLKCGVCQSREHPSALHVDLETKRVNAPPAAIHEGEESQTEVRTSCTEICGQTYGTGKSCSKILLVKVYPSGNPQLAKKMYTLIDDQSNRSLVTSNFIHMFGENGPETQYILSSCAGKCMVTGRLAANYIIESLDGSCVLNLPTLIECNDIPNNRHEIASPSIAQQYAHLLDIASFIPEIDQNAQIDLLIGRDLIAAHHVLDHRIGTGQLPYAQKLPLGWTIVGEVCLGKTHPPAYVSVNKTSILSNGRTTLFEPCPNELLIDTKSNIFHTTDKDESIGSSIEDDIFINCMKKGFHRDCDGYWSAPLPFREGRTVLANNRNMALKRAKSFDYSLKTNPVKKEHVVQFMKKIIDNNHAEIAPPLESSSECWYLPMFGVYHPKKPDSVRVVFDASAVYNGNSLNKALLTGPDLTNSLLGILLRFRKEAVAVTADVEQMFYNFKVDEHHRNYLRFIWHADNDIQKPLVDYRMRVHVFGNCPSPSVATYGLRKSVENAETDVRDFVNQNFYVDDGLVSCQSVTEAVDLVKRTQRALAQGGNLRLHKIASNNRDVLDQFDTDDLAKNLKNLDFDIDDLPLQRSLGIAWDINTDSFTFQVSVDNTGKPFCKRAVLSTINGLFDPIGFVAPVAIRGKLLLREMMASVGHLDWDEPLPHTYLDPWTHWVNTLLQLKQCFIPRTYRMVSYAKSLKKEVHIFSDASKDAIGAVAYLRLFDSDNVTVSFLLGKAKVAPFHGNTIPRLELCAAVLAAELADLIKEHMGIDSSEMFFYTDSKVVLGYLNNKSRRFHVYVGNRVRRVRISSDPKRWKYVATNENPADIATRGIHPVELQDSIWIRGPDFLTNKFANNIEDEQYELVDEISDKELRADVGVVKTNTEESRNLGIHRFEKYSKWRVVLIAVSILKCFARKWTQRAKVTQQEDHRSPHELEDAEQVILREVQLEHFTSEIECIKKGNPVSNSSLISQLSPFLDSRGILRVGGRLQNFDDRSDASFLSKHPVILPSNCHISVLVVRHIHEKVSHQERTITDGALRAAGYWIVGGRRLVSSVIHKCFTCRRLRGRFVWQQMADLPTDRITPSPPFTFVGVDTFGPWSVAFRRTRGTLVNQKRWALLFTCLVSRAIHIEAIEELSSASFINALRRFIAIRGPVKQFRSDRGTNFVGGSEELNIATEFVEKDSVKRYLSNNDVTWTFNPPHASHMGGVWERMIGVSRKVLDSMLLRKGMKPVTHEVLTTLLAEVTAIVNARPLVPVSTDPESPCVLSPAMILTHKCDRDNLSIPQFGSKDLLKSQWKQVQVLAEEFWGRWKSEYLNRLQIRQKWNNTCTDLKEDDVVLMCDHECARNVWPIGVIQQTFPSADEKVRKVQVRIVRDGKVLKYVRQINELILLERSGEFD